VQDGEVKHMLLADHGLDIYANGIGVRDDFLAKNPDSVRRFVRASLRGWKDALANPEEAAQLQAQMVKTLNPTVIAEELQVVRRLAVVPDTQKNGLGWIDRDKLKRTVDFVNANIEVAGRRFSADDIYRDGYLPQEAIRP
jgi:NitT/TauT family transport system substrate-binding protein